MNPVRNFMILNKLQLKMIITTIFIIKKNNALTGKP